jgi:phage terminase large subunit-like protein
MPSRDNHPHVEKALGYARDVVAGKVLACKWVRLACKRHIDDLEKQKTKDFDFRFDSNKAERVCNFIELLPHTKGKWAQDNELIRLEPWQCFKTCVLFGWINKMTGLRRFRRAFIEEPRKNAKSTWAAAVGLYMLTSDGEHGAEVYSGATSEKQSWEVFRPARLMAMRTPALQSYFGLTVNASNLHIMANGSRFEPLIGNPGDGASPSCAIIDEYHEHETDTQVDTMLTGMGAREQPILLTITTAGDNLSGPCYAAMQDAQKMLNGVWVDDELFAIIYTIDDEDKEEWHTEKALIKANPNYNVSVSSSFLLERQKEALRNPRKAGVFKTKHLNVWVQSRYTYFDIQRWIESADPNLKIEDFYGKPCRIGIDLASTVDIAAIELVFEHGDGYVRFGKYYLPEATIELPENQHYRGWRDAKERWITQTDGDMIDYVTIRDDLLEMAQQFQVLEIGFDPAQAMMMMSELREKGITCVEVRPLVLNFSPAMKNVEGLIRSRKIIHNGDPVMTWMMSNVVAKADAKDNVYPRKERPENKIDGPVAHMIAQARWLNAKKIPSFEDAISSIVMV